VHRFGRIIEKKNTREYASHYQDFVNALRGALTPEVEVAIGRVEQVAAGPDSQLVALADGRRYEARLLVVATGLGEVILRKLGIERQMLSANHSLALGFDLTNPPSSFAFPSLVYTVEGSRQRAAHLTFFPMGGRMRANFFTYRQVNEPWTHAFRKQPAETLDAFMPGVSRTFGPIGIEGHVSARPIDLMRAEQYRRPGVVLIGDAFFTVCPSSGTGMDKALHDVERLTHHLPRWFATPGMAAEKISQFYDDPLKLTRDAHAIRISLRARSMRMDNGIAWRARRLKSAVLVRAAYRARDLIRPVVALAASR
jgi:2-polyprenyl-6-methoxyphenol hydroxylase-like FAD-dependent oxidoreductase